MNDVLITRVSEISLALKIRELWSDVFGDEYSFIDDFYRVFPVEDVALAAFCGEEPVGMVNSIEVSASIGGAFYQGKYIYALAVKEAFRGKGIAKELLSRAQGRDFTLLVPENEKLSEMYRYLGYTGETLIDARFEEPQKFSENLFKKDMTQCVKALFKSEVPSLDSALFVIDIKSRTDRKE